MKNFLIVIFLLFGISLVGVYVGGNIFLENSSREALAFLEGRGKTKGLEFFDSDFAQVEISSLNSITWQGLATKIRITNNTLDKPALLTMKADQITTSFHSLHSALLEAWNLQVDYGTESGEGFASAEAGGAGRFYGVAVDADYYSIMLDLDPSDPTLGLKGIFHEISSFTKTGQTVIPMQFMGRISFAVNDTRFTVNTRMVQAGKKNALQLDRNDVKKMSPFFDDKLTDTEVDLISNYPLEAPTLFRMKNYAMSVSKKAVEMDPTVPEDAYRHVLWSCLLTKEYGGDFAEMVTDAHEVGLTGNTEAERQMDYNNNGVGRQYAHQRVPESSILERVRKDPAIIRKAR